jgi:hypothetical protein
MLSSHDSILCKVVVLILCDSVCYRREAQRSHAASPAGVPLHCYSPLAPSHNFHEAIGSFHLSANSSRKYVVVVVRTIELQCVGLPRQEAGESGPSRRGLDVCSVSRRHHFTICINQRVDNPLGPSKSQIVFAILTTQKCTMEVSAPKSLAEAAKQALSPCTCTAV